MKRLFYVIFTLLLLLPFCVNAVELSPGSHDLLTGEALSYDGTGFMGVVTIEDVDFSALTGSGNLKFFMSHTSGAKAGIFLQGLTPDLSSEFSVLCGYVTPQNDQVILGDTTFAAVGHNVIFDLRIIFYLVDGEGQWLIRPQYRVGKNWRDLIPRRDWSDGHFGKLTSLSSGPGAFANGTVNLVFGGWSGGTLSYDSVYIGHETEVTP